MTPYDLQGFGEKFDEWVEQEDPNQDLRNLVLGWIFTRVQTPYNGVRREAHSADYWWGVIPDSEHQGEVVVCSFWVSELEHVVRCDQLSSLSTPI